MLVSIAIHTEILVKLMNLKQQKYILCDDFSYATRGDVELSL